VKLADHVKGRFVTASLERRGLILRVRFESCAVIGWIRFRVAFISCVCIVVERLSYYNEDIPHPLADEQCRARVSGHLVSIHSYEEELAVRTFVNSIANRSTNRYWIGFKSGNLSEVRCSSSFVWCAFAETVCIGTSAVFC